MVSLGFGDLGVAQKVTVRVAPRQASQLQMWRHLSARGVSLIFVLRMPNAVLDPEVTPEVVARAWPDAGGIRAHQKNSRTRTELHRARNFFGDVERALFLQKFAPRTEEISHHRPKHSGEGGRRKRRRCRYRRWLGDRVQDRSHNHPSAIEPFQGAATGVGGIIRDIFTMGARPEFCLNSLRFGPITDPGRADSAAESMRQRTSLTTSRKRKSPPTAASSPASSLASRTMAIASASRPSVAKFISTKASREIRSSMFFVSAFCGTNNWRAARPAESATRSFMSARRRGAMVWPARRLPRGS